MDGRYKAEGRQVFRSPLQRKTGIKMGFLVCTVSEHLDDDAAAEIAAALNMHMDAHPGAH